MLIQGIYAAIATADMAAAEEFYTTIFGRGPDDRPIDGLIQWRNVANANVQIFLNDKNAGSSMCTIVVPEMDEARTSLKAVGISLGEERTGNFGKVAHIDDPDGNQITLAEPPKDTRTVLTANSAATPASSRALRPTKRCVSSPDESVRGNETFRARERM